MNMVQTFQFSVSLFFHFGRQAHLLTKSTGINTFSENLAQVSFFVSLKG